MKLGRRSLALLISVLLHGVLLAWCLTHRRVSPTPKAHEFIELEVNEVPSSSPSLSPAPFSRQAASRQVLSAAPEASTSRKKKTVVAGPQETARTPARSPSSSDSEFSPKPLSSTPAATASDAIAGGHVNGTGEVPRNLQLSPSSKIGDWAMQSGGGHKLGETWRNQPGGFPDSKMNQEASGIQAAHKIDRWIVDEMATVRANTVPDTYFSEVRQKLEEQAALNSQQLLSNDPKQELAKAWQDAANRYGATGNPYGQGTAPEAAPLIDTNPSLNRIAERNPTVNANSPNLKDRANRARMLRDFADGKFGAGLVAIVELAQGADGKLLRLTLQESSGNVAFDMHVMHTAPEAIGKLAPPPEKGMGIHPDGIRSAWSFQAHVVYKRKLRDMNLLRDGWYLGLLNAAGVLGIVDATGTFDEHGNIEVPDFRYPELRMKVKLLRVY